MAGNLFTVDFKATVDMSAAASSDSLEDALDYGRIYGIVETVMNGEHADLLEYLAGKIMAGIEKEFPYLEEFSVRVSKRRPPVTGGKKYSQNAFCRWGASNCKFNGGGKAVQSAVTDV